MEILFRGFSKELNKWVYGFYSQFTEVSNGKETLKHFIGKEMDGTEVYPESIGLWTGLTDKSGNKIFGAVGARGGDKIKYHQFLFDGNEYESTGTGIVTSGEYGWMLTHIIHDGISEYMGYNKQDQLDGKVETYLINVYGLHEESFEIISSHYETKG